MLLPESFQMGAPPEAFLAWDQTRGAIAGLAVCHRLKRETIGLRIITVRTHRRRGIGSKLLRCVRERAAARGDECVRTFVDLMAHPDAEHFLKANGFLLESRVLQIEGMLAVGAGDVRRLRERLAASGKIPPGARILDSRELPIDVVLGAYREIMAPHLPGRRELTEYIVTAPGFDAVILMVADRPAGMLAGVRNDGNGVASLDAVVVAPEFRSGWGWANILLLASAAERSVAAGASRLRFEIDERNWKVLKGIGRAEGTIIGVPSRFVLELASLS
jgi:ribosomal protein S18 acetylase RimI-like enzyme